MFSLYPNKICYADIKNQDVTSKVKNYEENDKNTTEGYIHIPDVIILDDSNNPKSSKKVESYSDTKSNSSLYFKEIVDNENNLTKIILGQNGNNGIVEFKHNSDTFTVTNGHNTIEYNVN